MASPYDNRDIVERYIYHKLLKRGYVWEFRAGSDEDSPGDAPRDSQDQVLERRLHRVLREAGDEIERTYQRDFAAMSDQLQITASTAQRRFGAVIEELFRDGVNWGRIVVFFEFGGMLCVESVNREMASQVDNIARWMTDYLNGPLQNWIRDNGGWVSAWVIETRWAPRSSNFSFRLHLGRVRLSHRRMCSQLTCIVREDS